MPSASECPLHPPNQLLSLTILPNLLHRTRCRADDQVEYSVWLDANDEAAYRFRRGFEPYLPFIGTRAGGCCNQPMPGYTFFVAF